MKSLFIAVILFTLSLTSYADQPKYTANYYVVVTSSKLVCNTYNAGNYFENDYKIRYSWVNTYKCYPVYTH